MAKKFFSNLLGGGKKDAPEAESRRPDETGTGEPPQTDDETSPSGTDERANDSAADEAPKRKRGLFSRLRDGLKRTSNQLSDGVTAIFAKRKLDAETLEDLEDLLISADLGVAVARGVTERLSKDRFDKEVSDDDVRGALADIVAATLAPLEAPLEIDRSRKPHVVLVAGVNGAGKTTTIGKLAASYKQDGMSVTLAAGDTFRAAAVEQLQAWGERVGAPVIAGREGAAAAGLAFDALKEAGARGDDVLLIDTAGRLQNKRELMEELAKIVRVLRKIDPDAPHDTLLVLDATVGQNAIRQAEAFKEIADVTGLVMTKLDGTARGGVLVALGEKFRLPIHYVGVGEGVEDLQRFDARAFAAAVAGVEA
ncbi:MAG: signal recognition particle-docking protein FtsY [Parvularculaceae bacterium]